MVLPVSVLGEKRMKTTYSPAGRLLPWVFGMTSLLGCCSASVQAKEYFNPALLEIDSQQQGSTDLAVFEEGVNQAPGSYRVDIYINDDMRDTRDVVFSMQKNAEGKESLQPCLSTQLLADLGVKTELFPLLGEDGCANFSAIPHARAEFRFNAQQLLLSMPQIAISQKVRGYVPPEQWDNGITALLFNYSLSGANSMARSGSDSNTQYANLRPGINLGPWRLRNYSTWSRSSDAQDKLSSAYTYAQRSIVILKSQLTLGDSTSPADVFESVPFRGVQLVSDDEMIPESQKGYAPVVRGIARSNAQVIIRQNGYVIYQSYVAAGAFEISDMYPTGGSGDLHVTIKEADGSEQLILVPFASLPVLQREGRLKYSFTGGQYRSYDRNVNKTPFAVGTAIYGLPHGVTAYGGVQGASQYQSLALGLGSNMGDIGALSVDITHAQATMQQQSTQSGQSLRTRYSKNMLQTGTNFAIAGYRYATSGYYGLQETMDSYRDGAKVVLTERRRNRAEATMTQSLWQDSGSLSLNLVSEDYWNSTRRLQSYGVGYNNNWHSVSYGLNYSYSRNSQANGSQRGKIYQKGQIIALNISIPLGDIHASYNFNSSQKGSTSHSVGLSGTALATNNLSWSVQQGYGTNGQGNSSNLAADYRGTYGEVSTGYAYDSNATRLNYGVQGGVVVHGDGVTLGQPLGETIALVKAPGASGVEVSSHTGVKTDYRGYAVVPYTSPYRKDQIVLNSATLSDDVELGQNTQNVVPTRGAVVRANFDTQLGGRVLMNLLRRDGTSIPFGATVSNMAASDSQGFIVGDAGQVYLTGLADSGTLKVQWGTEASQQCQVTYSLTHKIENNVVQIINGQCG